MRTIIVLITCLLFSCTSNKELDLHLKFMEYVDKNYKHYSHVHEKLNLWIEESVEKNRKGVQELLFTNNFKVDNMLLINEDESKLVGIITISYSDIKNSSHDWIFMISGIKISGEWNFFRGGSLYVPRENYIYDITKSLNHFQLSYIGRDFFLKRFLNFNGKTPIVNSDKINDFVSMKDNYMFRGNDPMKNWKAYLDHKNNKIISDKEFNKIQENLDNQVPTDKVLPEKGTKEWKELYGNKIPLFEREEWKNLDKK